MVAYSTVNPLGGLLVQRRSDSLLICLNLEAAPLKPGESQYCKISENEGVWGPSTSAWYSEIMRTVMIVVGLLLRVWESDRNITDWLCGSSSTGNMTWIKRSGIYPPLSQSTEPPLPVPSHRDLQQGESGLYLWSYSLWKSEVSYRMLCLHWSWRRVKNPGAINIYNGLPAWIFTGQLKA